MKFSKLYAQYYNSTILYQIFHYTCRNSPNRATTKDDDLKLRLLIWEICMRNFSTFSLACLFYFTVQKFRIKFADR